MSALMTFREYADAIGVNASTISRAVAKGKIPVVKLADGRRMIDRQAADSARRSNSNIAIGHGGKPDRSIRRAALWKARSATGFDPSAKAIFDAAYSSWPELMRRSMEVLGASELDQARACLALEELTACMACCCHHDSNTGRVWDYRTVLPEWAMPEWTEPETRAFVAQWGDDGGGGKWTSDEGGIEGGAELMEDMMNASWKARP